MISFAETFLSLLRSTHDAAKRALTGLPPEALDWVPGPEMNSLTVLATHTAGAERLLIGTMVGGRATRRNRDEEFSAAGATVEDLYRILDEALAESEAVLTELAREDLEKTTRSPISGREFPVSWALLHGLEHTANHVGHMEVTRQLWDLHRGVE